MRRGVALTVQDCLPTARAITKRPASRVLGGMRSEPWEAAE
jgi:hypothetical protein